MRSGSGRPVEERFWERVLKTDSCWLWLQADGTVADRYGRLRVGSRSDGTREELLMHWYSWELHNGPRTPGLQILHHCDTPPCVRPDHLYEGTVSDNTRDQVERGRHGKTKMTHCHRGHEFNQENTYWHGTSRHCRMCRKLRRLGLLES